MTDQVITIETATLAKEKGFPQNDEFTINVVTQSLLQKWLRDEKQMHIGNSYNFKRKVWAGYNFNLSYSANEYCKKIHNDLIKGITEYDTYEEALEAELQTVLTELND